jgi:23S rRNA pseudouridine1911/1915/1917 synthase
MINEGYVYRKQLGKEARGHTVSSYLSIYFTHSNHSTWQERLAKGEIEINHSKAHGDEHLMSGDSLVWHRPPWLEEDVPRAYTIIYQDTDLLVVNKPSGLPTMPAGNFLQNTLLSLLKIKFPTATPIHRLGRGTSGLIVFGLNQLTNASMTKLWQRYKVKKIYLALTSGIALKNDYKIEQKIGEMHHPKLLSVFAASESGKDSLSRARVVQRGIASTLFEVQIQTGRPHQIRIHLASIGYPLLGDPLYGHGGVPKSDALPGDGGYYLHAQRLEFLHPSTHSLVELTAPLPLKFKNVLDELKMQNKDERP